jgi:hypothetical protein
VTNPATDWIYLLWHRDAREKRRRQRRRSPVRRLWHDPYNRYTSTSSVLIWVALMLTIVTLVGTRIVAFGACASGFGCVGTQDGGVVARDTPEMRVMTP